MNNLLFGLLVFVTGFPAIAHARVYLGDPSTSCIIAKSVDELPYEIKSTKDREALKDVIEKSNFDCGAVSFAVGEKRTIGRVITVGCATGNMIVIIRRSGPPEILPAGDFKFVYPGMSNRSPLCTDSQGKYIIEK